MNLGERTLRNADVISPQEQAAVSSVRVLVAGCGSVGGSVVEPLVRLGLTSLVAADPEVYELSNINRQACVQADLGRSKAVVVAERAKAINPGVEVKVYPGGLTPDNLAGALEGVAVAFDAIDAGSSAWVKYKLHETACALRIPVLAGMDFGGQATIYVFDYRRWKSKPFYGKASEEAHREGRLVDCLKWLGYTHFPSDFLPVISNRLVTKEPWPQVSYCVHAMGALATRCMIDVLMHRSVPHVVSFDVHMRTRRFWARLGERLRFPGRLLRAFITSRRKGRGRPGRTVAPTSSRVDSVLEKNATLKTVLQAMVLSPSPHNVQPWRFEIVDDRTIRVGCDPGRRLPCVDPSGQAVAFSLGCAIEAAAQVAEIEFEPGDGRPVGAPGYLAGSVRIEGLRTDVLPQRLALLQRRCTNRRAFLDVPVSTALQARCDELAREFRARAVLCTPDLETLQRLTLAGARRQFGMDDYVEELLAHVRMSKREERASPTGFTRDSLAMDWFTMRFLALLRRSTLLRRLARLTGVPRMMASSVARLIPISAPYALVTTSDPTPRGLVDAGRAMMRIWLELTRHNLACQPIDFPISTEDGRKATLQLFGLGAEERPVVLLRVGRAAAVNAEPSPRLPLSQVCTVG